MRNKGLLLLLFLTFIVSGCKKFPDIEKGTCFYMSYPKFYSYTIYDDTYGGKITLYFELYSNYEASVISSYDYYSSPYCNRDDDYNLIIPHEVFYDGNYYRVTKIGKEGSCEPVLEHLSCYFDNCTVIVPPSVTSIEAEAFSNCDLNNVVLPESLVSIGEEAFEDCCYLPSIRIPSSVRYLKSHAFAYCYRLNTVTCMSTVPPYTGYDIFGGCSNLQTIYVPKESLTTYKTASGWWRYADIIVGF